MEAVLWFPPFTKDELYKILGQKMAESKIRATDSALKAAS